MSSRCELLSVDPSGAGASPKGEEDPSPPHRPCRLASKYSRSRSPQQDEALPRGVMILFYDNVARGRPRGPSSKHNGVPQVIRQMRSPVSRSLRTDGYGFDLDELVVVAQDADTEQSAGSVVVTEGSPNDVPRDGEIRLP